LKVKPKKPTQERDYEYTDFEVVEFCCDAARNSLGHKEYMDTQLNDNDTLMWGSLGEFFIDDVKFCPWCGSKIVVEI